MIELTPSQLAALPDWLRVEAARHYAHPLDPLALRRSFQTYTICHKDLGDWPCAEVEQFIRLADALLVLAWYADEENWQSLETRFGYQPQPADALEDAGERARDALAGLRPA